MSAYRSEGTARMKNKGRLFLLYFMTILIAPGIAVHASEAKDTARGRVTAGINLRAAPGLAGRVITGLEKGTVVTITGRQADWYQIAWENDAYGYRGWVYGKYIERLYETPVKKDPVVPDVKKNRPGPVTAVQKTEPFPDTGAAAGDAGILPPNMPTNTIELIQASTPPDAAVSDAATQPSHPAAIISEAAKTAEIQGAEANFSEKPRPTKTGPAIKASAIPEKKPVATPGLGDLLGLILKISSVFLSCLALLISFKTFHLVTVAAK